MSKEPIVTAIQFIGVINGNVPQDRLERDYPGRDFVEVEGQRLYPLYGSASIRSSVMAYLLASDWRDRKEECAKVFDGSELPSRGDVVIHV